MTISVRIQVTFTIQLQKCHCQIIEMESVLIMNLFGHDNSYLISVHQRYNNKTKSETLPYSE